MIFLTTIICVMYMGVYVFFKQLASPTRPAALPFIILGLAALAVASLSGFLPADSPLWREVSLAKRDTIDQAVVWLFLGGAILMIVSQTALLVSAVRGEAFRPYSALTGSMVVGIVFGAYIAAATIDHLVFTADSDRSGMVNVPFLGVEDVPCEEMALVRIGADSADWRCPTGVAFAKAGLSRPFMPWPTYESGSSRKLKAALDDLKKSAVTIDKSEVR